MTAVSVGRYIGKQGWGLNLFFIRISKINNGVLEQSEYSRSLRLWPSGSHFVVWSMVGVFLKSVLL